MKINFILPGYPWKPVGGFRVVYEYANNLIRRAHEVCVIHPRTLRNAASSNGGLRAKLHKRALYLRDSFLRPDVRWQAIDKRVKMLYVPEATAAYIPEGDFVIATAWQTAEYAAEYPGSKGKKVYLIQGYETWSGEKERVDATWRLPFKKITIAGWLYRKGLELGIRQEDMALIPCAVDARKFRIKEPVSRRPQRIAMLYNPDACKGFSDGIAALKTAHSSFPGLKAVIFGRYAKPKNLPGWAGYLRDPSQEKLVEDIYNASSIFLCSSISEGFPLPPAEAMACGCALVSTGIEGVREYARDGSSALLSAPGDPSALAGNLIRLLGDDKLRVAMAENGYRSIRAFSWERSTELLEELLTGYLKESAER